MEEERAAAFWRWSLASYPKVEQTLLVLQDRYGADVNLVLFCAWIGRLTPEALEAAEAVARPWREDVVEPLRRLRRQLKQRPEAAGLREQVKAAELEAERLAQGLLVEAIPAACGTADALALYLDILRVPEAERRALDGLGNGPKSILDGAAPASGGEHACGREGRGGVDSSVRVRPSKETLNMSLQDRLETLRSRHASLEQALLQESNRPLPNNDAIHDLKKQKLRIKDEIFALEKQH